MITAILIVCGSGPRIPMLNAVPYLGREEPYFLGSGVAGAGGDTHGKWDFLIGPDYTSPNFLSSEILGLVVDGQPVTLSLQMHRARGTGIFFGDASIGDLQVRVADFAKPDSPVATRLIRCVNRSANRTVRVAAFADIAPGKDISASKSPEGLILRAPKGIFCFGDETKNWADRFSEIGFSGQATTTESGGRFHLETAEQTLAPGRTLSLGLNHVQSYESPKTANAEPEADLRQCADSWSTWMRIGSKALAKITDELARNTVEGCLIACKSEQNRDGGTIAGVRKYANSYVRDTHGAVRLFLATGHVKEARKAIETINHKWSVAGFIPNYWSMGSDSFLGRSFRNDSSEITGYYALMIRDYLAKTHDRAFVRSVEKSLRFAIDSELGSMEKNGWRISFNGDETEQYCVRIDGQQYGGFPALKEWRSDSWSFPSAAIVAASTRFYAEYLEQSGRRAEAASYKSKLKQVLNGIDSTFWRPNHHAWARLPDGSWPKAEIPNYDLIPLWVGAKLNDDLQNADALFANTEVDATTGMLPTAPPEVLGYCGHNLAYLLYDLSALGDPKAKDIEHTILRSGITGCWGTLSEFYGPQGTPNGHNYRVFESGITGEALLAFFSHSFGDTERR